MDNTMQNGINCSTKFGSMIDSQSLRKDKKADQREKADYIMIKGHRRDIIIAASLLQGEHSVAAHQERQNNHATRSTMILRIR